MMCSAQCICDHSGRYSGLCTCIVLCRQMQCSITLVEQARISAESGYIVQAKVAASIGLREYQNMSYVNNEKWQMKTITSCHAVSWAPQAPQKWLAKCNGHED